MREQMNSAAWFIFLRACLCLFFASLVQGAPVSLESFQQHIRNSHPGFRIQVLDAQVAEKRRDAARGQEDWFITSNPYYRDEEPVSSSAFNPSELSTYGLDAALSRKIWKTGGELSMSLNYDYSDQITPLIEFPGAPAGQGFETSEPTFHRHRALITYLHPLLKNAGGLQDRLEYDMRDYVARITSIQAVENQEDLLLQLSSNFLQTVLLKEQRRIAVEREQLSREQLEASRQQRAQNLVDEVDLLRAENNEQLAKQRVVIAESNYRSALAELRVLAGYDEHFDPVFDVFATNAIPDTKALRVALEQDARLIRAIDLESQRLRWQGRALRDGVQAQLDLALSGGLSSGDVTYGDSLSFDQPEYQVGLRFSVPWGNRTIKRELEANELEVERNAKRREDLLRTLESGIQRIVLQMVELNKIIQLNQTQLESSRKQTAEEQKSYEQGRSPLTFVIQSRDGEAQAENRLVESAIQYQTLRLQLDAWVDALLPE